MIETRDFLKVAAVAAFVAASAIFGMTQVHAAGSGGDRPWIGTFSGNQFDPFVGEYNPISARGRFRTEAECRRFIYKQSGRLNNGPIRILSCTRAR